MQQPPPLFNNNNLQHPTTTACITQQPPLPKDNDPTSTYPTSSTRGNEGFLVVDPKDDFVAFALELDELLRLLQFETFLGQPQHQQVPKAMQLVEALLDVGGGEVTRLDHLQAVLIQSHDRVFVGHHLKGEKRRRGVG